MERKAKLNKAGLKFKKGRKSVKKQVKGPLKAAFFVDVEGSPGVGARLLLPYWPVAENHLDAFSHNASPSKQHNLF